MTKRKVSIILLIAILITNIPYIEVNAESFNDTIITNVETDVEQLWNGKKGVDYNVSNIYFNHKSGYKVDKDRFNINRLEDVIRIYNNGIEEDPVDSKGNSRYKIIYEESKNRLNIEIQEGKSNETHTKPFILKKHKHYNIRIPNGFFVMDGNSNSEINYNFITRGDGSYGEDIISNTYPENQSIEIDYRRGEIKISFIDDIELETNVYGNLKDYISIYKSSMTSPEVDNYDSIEEDLSLYTARVYGNQLILSKNNAKLDDFANYKVEIRPNTVVLKNSKYRENIVPIMNDFLSFEFKTDSWVEWTYPVQNQGAGLVNPVERNPLIQVKFKYPVELIDSSKIEISSDGNIYAVDINKDSWIGFGEENILKIDINGLYRKGKNPLRANSVYRVKIKPGAIRLKHQEALGDSNNILNNEINLYFTTGSEIIEKDRELVIKKINNSPDILVPSIESQATTGLNNMKGSSDIYVHFDNKTDFDNSQNQASRYLQWNQWTVSPPVKNDIDGQKYIKLYKFPKAYRTNYTENGVVYDEEIRYNGGQTLVTRDGKTMEEVPIDHVEIVRDGSGKNTNILKISPKYDLLPNHEYRIVITKAEVLTDNYERYIKNGAIISNNGRSIWTERLRPDNTYPSWDMDLISAEEVIEVEKLPHIEDPNSKAVIKIHGAPSYNNKIDSPDGKPMVLVVDDQVAVKGNKTNLLRGINLYEGHDGKNIAISWYKLEYFKDKGRIKTRISLYPNKELEHGKYYRLKVNSGIFENRHGRSLAGIEARFTVEGKNDYTRGIDKVLINGSSPREYLREDFLKPGDLDFEFIGYNFSEDIERIEFKSANKTISIANNNSMKFVDINKINWKMKASDKHKFAAISNSSPIDKNCSGNDKIVSSAGNYEITIYFGRGQYAKTINPSRDRIVIKDSPNIIGTNPKNGAQYVNPSDLLERHNGQTRQYLEIEYDNLNGELRLLEPYDTTGIRIYAQDDEETNLVDDYEELRLIGGTVKIPLKTELENNKKYTVEFPAGKVYYPGFLDKDGQVRDGSKGRCFTWSFETNKFTVSNRLYEGSVVENYDYRYPIVIDGKDYIKGRTDVYFRMSGNDRERYYPDDIEIINMSGIDSEQRLLIYLPRRRMPVGVYDIIISNGRGYSSEIKYGVLSIVEEGKHVPNEDYHIKHEDRDLVVKGDNYKSKDLVELGGSISLVDLDDLVGEETWLREVQYNHRDISSFVSFRSKWIDADLEGIRPKNSLEKNIIFRIGRVDPSISDGLKRQFYRERPKSNFVEVRGENLEFNSLKITIPYFESDGENLKMLKYDEEMAIFEEVSNISIDQVDGKVQGLVYSPGIFVIVQ